MNTYTDYIFPSYGAPFVSSFGMKIFVTGFTTLGPFHLETVGIQARLIGLFFLLFSFLLVYHLLIQIPKSMGQGKVKEILGIFFVSPFFIAWIACVFVNLFSEFLPYGMLSFLGMLIVCFYFQRKFNKKLIEIYNK